MLEAPLLENSIKYVSIEDPTIDESIRKAMIIGQHMRDGRYAEWLGLRIIADADQRYEWEVRAYNAEISPAVKVGHEDIADKLRVSLEYDKEGNLW